MSVFKVGLCAAASLAALAALPAHAQETPQDAHQPAAVVADGEGGSGPTTVEEVVVTASPVGVAEKALTANVDVLDEKKLDLAPAVSLGDVVAGLPGVRSSSFAPGASRPVIRGLSGPRVMVLSNGLGMIDASAVSDDHSVAVDPSEAERIEVVRGPNTLAYGGSAIGGVVNVIDGRIPDSPAEGAADGRFTAQASSVDNGWSSSGRVKVSQGPWVATLQATRRESDDYDIPGPAMSQRLADALGVPRTGPSTVENSFAQLTEFGGGLSYVGSDGFLGGSVKQTESHYGTVAESDVTIQLRQTRGDVRGEADLDAGPFERVKASAGYADYKHTEFEGPNPGTVFLSTGWEGRLELVQKKHDNWQGAVGFQAVNRSLDAIGAEALIPPTEASQYSAYTVQRIDRGRFGFEAGARIEGVEVSSPLVDRSFTNLSGSAGVFMRPATGLYLGLSLARFERAPNEIELFADGPHPATGQYQVGDAGFDSEVANSVELAVHYDLDRWSADLHLFGARYEGFIDLRPTGAVDAGTGLPVYRFQQTGAQFHGFEAQLGYDAWTDGERTFRIEAVADSVRGDTDLGPPARIPPWSATLRTSWTTPRWDASAEVRRVGEQNRVAALELPTDGYTLVNLHAAWRPFSEREIELYADLHNATDEEAREHASALKDIAPMPGRNLRVGLSYRF
jgi:iron complex outermembrane receptor protein